MIDVLNLPPGDIFKVCPELEGIHCFVDFSKKESGLPLRETIMYVYLLYTKESFINKRPMDVLSTRRIKSAKIAGLDPEEQFVKENIFGTETFNEESRINYAILDDLIVNYLLSQSSYQWSDRCAIDAQMEENLRIRFKPIESGKGDKDIIEASTKKFLLTEHFSKYKDIVRKLDLEIFTDHDEKRDVAVRKKTSLESLVKP